MKKLLLSIAFLGSFGLVFGQIINDNKVSFGYVQLPFFKIDNTFTTYDVKVAHGYLQANNDSLAAHASKRQMAMSIFENAMASYESSRDSVDLFYFQQMATWEKDVNAGKLLANGLPLPEPARPIYPRVPVYPSTTQPRLHTAYPDNSFTSAINIEGFTKGMGGFVVTVNMLPLQNIVIKEAKTGTGATVKYSYTAHYVLPVEVTVETPTQGKLIFLRILENTQTYKIGDYKSKYDYKLYMLSNEDQFYTQLETTARANAVKETNNYLNDQIGYRNRTRNIELYSVKKFKDYNYTDVTNAYTLSLQALQSIQGDRSRANAFGKIETALVAWAQIMTESNTFDKKARINDKITAMIQVNMAELQVWKADFMNAQMNINLAINEGGKFKRHANSVKGFYTEQNKRWDVHY